MQTMFGMHFAKDYLAKSVGTGTTICSNSLALISFKPLFRRESPLYCISTVIHKTNSESGKKNSTFAKSSAKVLLFFESSKSQYLRPNSYQLISQKIKALSCVF